MELEQLIAGCRRAFREKTDGGTLGQHVMHGFVDLGGVAAAGAPNENGARLVAQPARDRPIANLRFGDKARGVGCVDDENIHPGNMIRSNNQISRIFKRSCAVYRQQNIEDAQ